MTINEGYINLKKNLLTIYEIREAGNIADLVIEKLTGLNKVDRLLKKEKELDKEQLQTLASYLNDLQNHKPVQYVLNEAWFAGLKLYVDETVLIPRPETEELVEWIVKDINFRFQSTGYKDSLFTILDVGTGSGCIAIALKKQINNAIVFALDVSNAALPTAKKNAVQNNVDVQFFKADILQPDINIDMPLFDIIVSNPPYISEKEMSGMDKNVIENEPHIALFVPDENPLVFYNQISQFAISHLKQNGCLYFEIHEHFGKEIVKLLAGKSFHSIELKKDMQGKDRMVKAVYSI